MTPHQLRLIRSLSILRQLQNGPTNRDELLNHVLEDVGPDAYGIGTTARGIESQFSRDIKFLREKLFIKIPNNDRRTGLYEIITFGDFRPLWLSDDEMGAMALLLHTFQPGTPMLEDISRLLNRITELLPDKQQETFENRRQRHRLDIRHPEGEQVNKGVLTKIAKALSENRELQFRYRSSGQEDNEPRTHVVQPYQQIFEPSRGRLYLDAYWLTSDGPLGKYPQNRWQLFRLDRILADEHLKVLLKKLPPTLPRRPRYQVEYLLSPKIARLGQITRHFDNMAVHEADEDGWVRVNGTTDSIFRAARLFLGYGPNCKVMGGDEVRAEMMQLVQGMATLYGFNNGVDNEVK